jgi:hypothetical protein
VTGDGRRARGPAPAAGPDPPDPGLNIVDENAACAAFLSSA